MFKTATRRGIGAPVSDLTVPTPANAPIESPIAKRIQADSKPGMTRDAGSAQIPLGMNLPGGEITLTQVVSPDLAAAYFRRKGLEVDDKREKGGALWVYSSQAALAQEMAVLRRQGLRFTFTPKRSGWFLNSR